MSDTRHPESNNPSPFYVYPHPSEIKIMLQTLQQFSQLFNSTEWDYHKHHPATVRANLKMANANADIKTK